MQTPSPIYIIGDIHGHLKKLVKDARRQEPQALEAMAANATPTIRQVLRRADMR